MSENKFKYGLGYIQSPKDDRDAILSLGDQAVPEKYIVDDLRAVYDQGAEPICAAVGLSTILTWRDKISGGSKNVDPWDVYELRTNKDQEGMVLRDAIKQIKKNGVDGTSIKAYARIQDPDSAKAAILLNGPLIIGTYAYNEYNFWKRHEGEPNMGGHATLLVGFDKDGFRLMNSWGTSWGQGGFMDFPYDDWGCILEAWTILI